ncbi:MAG: DUF881 domain-containing protein [Peptococcaceae bacterium]|nr:DUF881 domain-containing protein [Peptococcaceae bacterium]
MRLKGYHFALFFSGLAISLLLTFQFRITKEVAKNPTLQQTQTLVSEVNTARQERDALKKRIDELRARLESAAVQTPGPLKEELDRTNVEAGLVAVSGPGVEVTLNDSNVAVQPGQNPNLYVLHDEDVLSVLNELKAAGAEALAINGQRLLATSEIRCTGPTIVTNKSYRLTPPFVISAIGNQDNMVNSLQMRGGVVDQLKFWGIQISIKRVDNLTIPAYTGSIRFDYARPVAVPQEKAAP